MSFQHRLKAAMAGLLVAVLATVTAVVLVQSPAQASFSDCNSGEMCLFGDNGGGGSIYRIYGSLLSTGVCYDLPGYFNDITTSMTNQHSSRKITLYSGYSCANDGALPAGPLSPGNNLGFVWPAIYWTMNNKGSAFKLS